MKTKTWLALLAALAVIALAAVAAGCGGDDTDNTGADSGNTADAAFVADMTAHHQGAIEMARIAQKRAEHPEIKQLADDIVAAQEGEISTMKSLQADLPKPEGDDGHMGMSDAEMGMDMDPAMLEDAKPFDRAFIDMMVPHHEGAVVMAKQLLKDGENAKLRKMADDVIDAQTKEIAQMREWRKDWYGSAGSSTDPMADHGH